MRVLKLLFICLTLLTSVHTLKAQNLTGTDFWFVMPENASFRGFGAGEGVNEVFIVSQYCIDSAYIDIEAYDQRIYFSVEPGNFYRVAIPFFQDGEFSFPEVSDLAEVNAISQKGVHIESPLPISVYFSSSAGRSSDGESIIPTDKLGTSYVMSFRNMAGGCNYSPDDTYGYVLATEDNTNVTIDTWDDFGPVTYSVALDAGQIYTWETNNNCSNDFPGNIDCLGLSGTVVTADKNVTTFSSASCGSVGQGGNCDVMMASYLPFSEMETDYVVAQVFERGQLVDVSPGNCRHDDLLGSGDYVEITGRIGDQVEITSRLGTETVTIPPPTGTGTNYGYGSIIKEIPESLPNDFGESNMFIHSLGDPVQIVQYTKGRHADDITQSSDDPADVESMSVMPPSLWESSYFFYPIRTPNATTQELVVVVEDVGIPSPIETIEVNDANIGATGWIKIPNTDYKFKRISFPTFEASKVASTIGANIGLYFFARGVRETAFFTGGYGPIADLNLCDQCGEIDITVLGSTCLGSEIAFEPRIYSFTRPSSLNFVWNFGDGTTSTQEFPTKTYSATGAYTVTLQVSGTGGCILETEKTVYVNDVVMNPEATPDTVCLGSETRLTSNFQLTPGGNQIVQYRNEETEPIEIPDGAVSSNWNGTGSPTDYATSIVNVTGVYNTPGRIDSICINLDHELVTDVNLYLVSPTNVVYSLMQNPQSIGRTNLRKTCFSPSATENITDAFPPYTGSYIPEGGNFPPGGLAADISGNWQLRAGDENTNFRGRIIDWSVYISAQIGLSDVSWTPLPVFDGDFNTASTSAIPDTTEYYYIDITDFSGCNGLDSVEVNVQRLPIEFNSTDSLLCNIYNDFNLFDLINDEELQQTGTWSWENPILGEEGRLTDNIFDTDGLVAGVYDFKYLEEIFCGFDSALVSIRINELPDLGTGGVDTLCDTEGLISLIDYQGPDVTPGGIWSSFPILTSPSLNSGGDFRPNLTTADDYLFFYKVPVEACPLDSSVVSIRLNHQPDAGSNGDTIVCESGIPLSLALVLNDNPETGGVWEDTDNSGGLDIDVFRSFDTPTNPNSETFDFVYTITAGTACIDSSATATVEVSAAPEIVLTPSFPILCKDSSVLITATLEGNGPFDLEISDGNGNFYPAPGELPVGFNYAFSQPLAEETTFNVTRLIDNAPLQCEIVKPTSLTVEVYEPIVAKLIEERCILNPDGITFLGFTPVIDLTGGDGTNYRYDLFVDGSLVKSNAQAPNALHELDTLPNGVEYSYRFYDGSNCPDVEAVFNRRPRKYCECATFAGTMDLTTLEVCEYDAAVVSPATNFFTEPEDTLYYILHDRGGIVLGNRLDSNATPEFTYNPSLEYDKTYYISAIAGDSLLGGINPMDTCVSVADGTPVIFRQQPDVTFSAASADICEGDVFELELDFVGNGPFTLTGTATTTAGTEPISYTGLNLEDTLRLNPLLNTVYRFDNVLDGNLNTCSRALSHELAINVSDLPRVRILDDDTVAICEGSILDLTINIAGGVGPFRLEFLKDGTAFGPAVVTTNNNYQLSVAQQGLYQVNAILDQGTNCGGLVLDGSVFVEVKQQPVANAGASPIEPCGSNTLLEAQPSVGIGRWQQPTGGFAFSNPNNPITYGFVPSPGPYTLVWEEENAPCPVSRDTVFATFYEQPNANAGPDSLFCGTDATLYATPSVTGPNGTGFWVYEGLGDVTFIDAQEPNSGVQVGTSGTYDLVWREIADGRCIDYDTVAVTFSDFLRASVIDTICLNNGANYQFVINVSGGDQSSITVNGQLVGELPYTTPVLNSGEFYKFGFSDQSNCGFSDTLRTTIGGSPTGVPYGCPCISDAGTVANTDTVEYCFGDRVSLNGLTDAIKDSDDTLIYVLHTSSVDTLGEIIQFSSSNSMSVNPGSVIPGQVYYFSRLVGSKTGSSLGVALNEYCTSLSPGVPVIFRRPGTAIVQANTSLCDGESVQFGIGGTGVGPYSFNLKTDPSAVGANFILNPGDQTPPTPLTTGTYTYYITNFQDLGNAQCTELNTTSIVVNVHPNPSATVNFDPEACEGESILFSATELANNVQVSWNFGDGSNNKSGNQVGHTYSDAGTYTITNTLVNQATGCLSTLDNNIEIQAAPDLSFTINGFADFQDTLCVDEAVTILNTTGTPGVTYEWFVDGIARTPYAPLFTENPIGDRKTLRLTGTTSAGCFSQLSQTVNVSVASANLDAPAEVCSNAELFLRFTNPQNVASFEWEVAGNTYNTNPLILDMSDLGVGGILNVNLMVTSPLGCETEYNETVDVNLVSADFVFRRPNGLPLPNNASICLGDSVLIRNNGVNVASVEYGLGDGRRSNLTGDVVVDYGTPGVYRITQEVVSFDGCVATTAKNLTVNALPNVPNRVFEVCVNTDTVLNVRIPNGNSYEWRPFTSADSARVGSTFGSAIRFLADVDTVPLTFNYMINFSDLNGCSDSSLHQVVINGIAEDFSVPNSLDSVVIKGDSMVYSLPQIEGLIYTWGPAELFDCVNCPNQTVRITEPTEFFLRITDIFGCIDDLRGYNFTVDEDLVTLDVPDAFSPNGDGINDVIYPQGFNVEQYESFRVYNRFGELVFEGAGQNPAWDGTINGEPAAVDNYYYVVRAKVFGERIRNVKQGTFELIR